MSGSMDENKGEIKIIPLSAVNLSQSEHNISKDEIDVYCEILDRLITFVDKSQNSKSQGEQFQINNIAITGEPGIGKSSLIRTVEKERKKKFLYLSINNFRSNADQPKVDNDPQQDGVLTKDEQSKDNLKKEVEHDLLNQLITKCTAKDLPPRHGLKTVKERSTENDLKRIRRITVVLIALIMIWVFSTQISETVHLFLLSFFGDQNSNLHSYLILLKFACIITAFVEIFVILNYCFLHVVNMQVNVKLGASDNSVETKLDNQSGLDFKTHSTELTYILEYFAAHDKYQAIIFEDFDRIDEKLSIDILTYIHNINSIVNFRLKDIGRYLTFIYVITDDLMSKFQSEKFFDYILPIIPTLSERSVDVYLINMLSEVHARDVFHGDDPQEIKKKLKMILHSIHDYRILNTIMNEFSVIRCVVKKRGNSIPDEKILAFAASKVLLPEVYAQYVKTGEILEIEDIDERLKEQKYLGDLILMLNMSAPEIIAETEEQVFRSGSVEEIRRIIGQAADNDALARMINRCLGKGSVENPLYVADAIFARIYSLASHEALRSKSIFALFCNGTDQQKFRENALFDFVDEYTKGKIAMHEIDALNQDYLKVIQSWMNFAVTQDKNELWLNCANNLLEYGYDKPYYRESLKKYLDEEWDTCILDEKNRHHRLYDVFEWNDKHGSKKLIEKCDSITASEHVFSNEMISASYDKE